MKERKKCADPKILERTKLFFKRVQEDPGGKKLLREQNQRIEFDLSDDKPFQVEIKYGRLKVKPGLCKARRFDNPNLTHFKLETRTLHRLLDGEIRFTDALIPTDPDGEDTMLLLDCTLFKWSVLNWIGRLFRAGQLPVRFRD